MECCIFNDYHQKKIPGILAERVRLLGIIFITGIISYSYGESMQSASNLAESYGQALSCWERPFSIQINTQIKIDYNGKEEVNTDYRESECLFHWDGKRADQSGSEYFFDDQSSETAPYYIRQFALLLDGQKIYSAEKTNEELYTSPDFTGVMIRNGYSQSLVNMKADPYLGGVLFGQLYGQDHEVTLADVLKESRELKILSQEKVNGYSCYVVEGDSVFGTLRAWISPDKAGHALRIVLTKKRNDHHILPNGMLMKDSSFKEMALEFDWTDFKEIEGGFYPQNARSTKTIITLDGDIETTQITTQCKSIDLNPDFAALDAFTLNKLEGALIYDYDFQAISYKVLGGKLVPYVDELIEEVINQEMGVLKTELLFQADHTEKVRQTKPANIEVEIPENQVASGAPIGEEVPTEGKAVQVSFRCIILALVTLALLLALIVWSRIRVRNKSLSALGN